jgi:hypothetical protein
MAGQTSEITKVRLDLDETEMAARWKNLIAQLAARAPADDLTDADIDREVRAVRARSA